MAKWVGTQTQGGDVSVGTEDLIQDAFSGGIDGVDIAHFNFFCEDACQVQIDDNDPQWFSAETEIEFTTEYDRNKMPKKNFKVLTSDVTYEHTIIFKQ